MKRKILHLFTVLTLVVSMFGVALPAMAATITLDGDPSDWAGIPPIVNEPGDSSPPGSPDIATAFLTHDTNNLYARVDMTAMVGATVLYISIDADQNIATGYNTDTDPSALFLQAHNIGIDYQIKIIVPLPPTSPMAQLYSVGPDWNPTPIQSLSLGIAPPEQSFLAEVAIPLSLIPYAFPWKFVFWVRPGATGSPYDEAPNNDSVIYPSPPHRIVFVSDRNGNLEIYSMNDEDGSNQTRLTSDTAYDNMPFPSRKAGIVFVSGRDGNREIYVMNDAGANQTQLTVTDNVGNAWPAWSPDKTRIVFSSDRDGGYGEIYTMNATDGSDLVQLTNNSTGDTHPAWSSTDKIAFTSIRDGGYGEIYTMNADGTNQTRLTNNPAADNFPAWSPDGTKIAFASDRDGDFEIYVMNADSTNLTQLTSNSAWDWQPQWGPDGTRIAFSSNRDGNWEIYAMSPDGADQANLTNNSAADFLRGKWIAPSVVTNDATNITSSSAVLSGSLTGLGSIGRVKVSFQWGLTAGNYTGATPPQVINATGPFSANLTGLSGNTTYYFRAKAAGDGVSYGEEKIFTTSVSVPPTPPEGTVWAWGYNLYGQLGDDTTTDSHVPIQVSGLTEIVAVSVGAGHSLALESDGTVWAWGCNGYGQLGNGNTTDSHVPIQVGGLTGMVAVSAGNEYSLALKSDGTAWAWGLNGNGQLGNDSSTNSDVPVPVSGLTGVVAVSAGAGHSLALKSDGTVWAWGSNSYGQLGNGNTIDSLVPVQVSSLTGVMAVSTGNGHSLALKSDGTVWAWGFNLYGQLGNDSTTNSDVPVPVSGLNNVVAIAAYYHSLAVESDGTIWAWGWNGYGQLGNGNTTESHVPVQVSGLSEAVAVSAGYGNSLVTKSDGTAWVWGWNEKGQLGNNSTTNSYVPIQVSGLSNIVAIAGSYFHSLALKATTDLISPTVTTNNATAITATSATLNGTLTDKGTAANVTVSFDWGLTTDNYTTSTPSVSMNTTGNFSFTLDGLSANTTYYFRAKAAGDGVSYGEEQSFTTLEEGLQPKNWTFMVYMCGDNNLDGALVEDLNEMEAVGSTDNVSVVALLDRYGSGNSNIYYVTQDTNTNNITSPIVTGPFGTSEVNMGNPQTLVEFVKWAIANYPANHYALVLSDHGSGWRINLTPRTPFKGICFDETSSNDRITTGELGNALAQIKTETEITLDIAGFDACLMQMAEIASPIKNSASIMVGSEEVEPGDGWPYDLILTYLTSNPASTPQALAIDIVNQYQSFYDSHGTGIETMSALNLGSTATLEGNLNTFANSMVASGQWQRVVTARTPSESFYDDDYIDLYHFAQNVKTVSNNATVQGNAQAVMDTIANTVIAEGHGTFHPNAHGLSIYYPLSGSIDPNYSGLSFASGTWDEFLGWYLPPRPPTWTQIISDPIGDQLAEVGPDIVGVDSSLSANLTIAFQVRFNDTIDFNTAWSQTILDTDENPATGWPIMGAMGADYFVYVSTQLPGDGGDSGYLPRFTIDTKGRQAGQPWAVLLEYISPEEAGYVSMLPLSTNSTSYWTMVPLSLLGSDDGQMSVMQHVGEGFPPGPSTATDIAPNPPPPPINWKQLIDDPTGDGTPQDIIGVDVFRQPDKVGFKVRGNFDFGNFAALTPIDIDQNPATGKTQVHDLGADYLVTIISSGSLDGTLNRWNLDNLTWDFITEINVSNNNTSFWFEIPLSQLGNDQGNMDFVQRVGTPNPTPPPTITDEAPDTGHASINEPRWSELISDPTEGVNPDITGVDFSRWSEGIAFRVRANGMDFYDLFGNTYMDIDQNPATGDLGNIGADYMARVSSSNVSVPLLDGQLFSWSGTEWTDAGGLGVFTDGNYFWFGISYDRLVNADNSSENGTFDVWQYIGPLSGSATDRAPDSNYVTIAPRATIEESTTDGIAWLASQQNPDGSWGTKWSVAKTGLAVLKLETHATSENISPFDPSYPYHTQVEAGLDYLFANAHGAFINPQPAGNPDTNSNGKCAYFYSTNITGEAHYVPVYETSIVMMAIAASNAPDRVVNVPDTLLNGVTYRQVLQDCVDYLAWAQTDSGYGRGGWNYEAMNNQGDRSDQSNTGWATLALAYAESPSPIGFSLNIPGFVRTELSNYWIDYIQDNVNGDDNDGGAWYTGTGDTGPNKILGANVLRTGNLLQQMAFVGDTENTTRVQAAIDYLVRHWNDEGEPGWRGNYSNYHATYTIMKGLEAFKLDTIGSSNITWFQDFVDALLLEQNPNGSWPASNFDDGEQLLSTEWALLTLQKTTAPTMQKPDLVVSEKHEEWVNEGAGTYKVYFTIQNRGNVEAPAGHQMLISIDGIPQPSPIINWAMAPGDTWNGTNNVTVTLTEGKDVITVCVDAESSVDELNEDNNCRANTWPAVQVKVNAPALVGAGGHFTATIDINEVENFDGCQYDISFNPAVLSVDNVTDGDIGGTIIPVAIWHQLSPGLVRVVQNVPGLTGVNGTGHLAVLHFHAIGSANQSSNITLLNGLLGNNQAQEISATWLGDSVMLSVMPGDANGDGRINAVDITKVERIIVWLDAPTPGADANQDGQISFLDVTTVEMLIAGLDF